jgi:hypothetical protein
MANIIASFLTFLVLSKLLAFKVEINFLWKMDASYLDAGWFLYMIESGFEQTYKSLSRLR